MWPSVLNLLLFSSCFVTPLILARAGKSTVKTSVKIKFG